MRRDGWIAAALVGALLVVYHANGGLVLAGDSLANMLLATSVLHDGDVTFTAEEAAPLLRWSVRKENRAQDVLITHVDHRVRDLIDSGALAVDGTRYLAVPTERPGVYASTFPPGSAWFAVPFYVFAWPIVGDISQEPWWLWHVSKGIAALSAAISAAMVYLICRRLVSEQRSLLLAIAYALGTSVWTTSSQGLWQHGPAEMFLAIGVWLLSDPRGPGHHAGTIGLMLGAATLCRPTLALVVIAVGALYLLTDALSLRRFIVAGLPLALFLAAYNQSAYGAPLRMGEALVPEHAIEKTGSADVFSTPVLLGISTSLFSPSRGLFIFSPFLLAAIVGAGRVFQRTDLTWQKPLIIATVGIWFVQSIYFDYWGGWTYGNRNLVDTVVLLMPMVAAAIDGIFSRAGTRWLFMAAVVWSVLLQGVGAWCYDLRAWNGREIFEVNVPGEDVPRSTFNRTQADAWAKESNALVHPRSLNIDLKENRHRFWSIRDSQLAYTFSHLREGYTNRRALEELFATDLSKVRAANHARLAEAFAIIGDDANARESWKWAHRIDPTNKEYARQANQPGSPPKS